MNTLCSKKAKAKTVHPKWIHQTTLPCSIFHCCQKAYIFFSAPSCNLINMDCPFCLLWPSENMQQKSWDPKPHLAKPTLNPFKPIQSGQSPLKPFKQYLPHVVVQSPNPYIIKPSHPAAKSPIKKKRKKKEVGSELTHSSILNPTTSCAIFLQHYLGFKLLFIFTWIHHLHHFYFFTIYNL